MSTTSPPNLRETPKLQFVVEIEARGPFSYKALRNVIAGAINAFPYLTFVKISENCIPDRYELTDPDRVPPDFS